MALITTPTAIVPASLLLINAQGQVAGYTSRLIDAAAEKVAMLFRAPRSGNITHVGWRTGVVTTSDSLDIRVETADAATGFPTGTLATANAYATRATVASNTWYWEELTAAAAQTLGTWYAVVVQFTSWVAGNLNVSAQFRYLIPGDCYTGQYISSWAKGSLTPVLGLFYDDNTFCECSLVPAATCVDESFGSSNNPNHRGLKFRVAVPRRLKAAWAHVRALGDFDLKFTADGGANFTTLGSVDKDITGSTYEQYHRLVPASPISLAANTWYRIVVVPTTTTSIWFDGITTQPLTVNTVDYNPMLQLAGGTDFIWTQANNPTQESDWTDTPTKRPIIHLELDQGDDGTGGSGGLLRPVVMNGGMA